MNSKRSIRALTLTAAVGLTFTAQARAQQVVAVLSSKRGAYLEAFSAFTAAYGAKVPSYDLSAEKPGFGKDTRIVVAFGGKASAFGYPADVLLIYCLAPGFSLNDATGGDRAVKISMVPDPDFLLSTIKIIQPAIRSLGVFWLSPWYSNIVREFKAAGDRSGIEVKAFQLEKLDTLPSLLRSEISKLDAFWVPPDPQLMNQDTMQQLTDFSWDNGIAFYGSARSLAKGGAVASLGLSFAESGRAAAKAALDALGGRVVQKVIYSSSTELSLNFDGAKKCGITLPPETVKEAAYAFP